MSDFTPVTVVQPCPPHQWAHAPTVGYYSCMNCRKRVNHDDPEYATIMLEHSAHLATVPPPPTPGCDHCIWAAVPSGGCHICASSPPNALPMSDKKPWGDDYVPDDRPWTFPEEVTDAMLTAAAIEYDRRHAHTPSDEDWTRIYLAMRALAKPDDKIMEPK